MDKLIMNKIDQGCIPTASKYLPEQLIGAIIKFIIKNNASSFTGDFKGREIIKEVGVRNFKQALLEHVVKLDALHNIEKIRYINDFSKDYAKHSVGETELRLFETLKLSVDDVFNVSSITDALRIIERDGVALYNVVTSFVDYRYQKSEKSFLDTKYLESDLHKQIIWKIEEHFKNNK